jgi:hypothetical protein
VQIEHAVSRLGFSRVSIHRPGVLLTRRLGESRPVEQIAQALLPRFHWLLSFLGTMGERWKAVQVETVAEFVRQAAESQPTALAQKHEYGAKELALCTAYAAEESKGGRELKSLLPSVGRATTQVEIFENEIIRGRKI